MPALGMAMTEGILLQWLKQPGDVVVEGEPVVEIETDKATMEVGSPAAGRLGPQLFAAGETVPVGTPITTVLEAGDAGAADAAGAQGATGAPAAARALRSSEEPTPSLRPADRGAPERTPHTSSPRQRMLEAERTPGAGSPASAPPDRNVAGHGATAGSHRGIISAKVSESWRTIPHFAVTRQIDAEVLMAELDRLRNEGVRATVTDLLLQALAHALRESGSPLPIDVGLAVATPRGVAIPVLRDVAGLDPSHLAEARIAAVDRARTGRLDERDVSQPPPASLSNLGSFDVDQFTGVIPLGQTALLTVGRIAPRVVVSNGAVAVRSTFHATLNVDHRAMDGDGAATMLGAFAAFVERRAQSDGGNAG